MPRLPTETRRYARWEGVSPADLAATSTTPAGPRAPLIHLLLAVRRLVPGAPRAPRT